MINEKIYNLPDHPGIYLFYNSKKDLIYIGKATSLKNRVRSYFRDNDHSPLAPLYNREGNRPIEAMIHEVQDIKTIQTDSVLEAIILEANYIKKFQPKYNVDLKDDKSWNYIVITNDLYPRVNTVRQHELDNLKLKIKNLKFQFGPYPGLKTREMMKLLQKLFSISVCKPCEPSKPCRPCLYYQLGQCLGVCTGEITPSDYKKKVIKLLVQFLSGKKKSLLKNLEKAMKLASKNHEFEEAGRLRDQIWQLNRIQDIALLNKSFVGDEFKIKNLKLKIRIEGYDVSNLGSSNMVGSMVVFENGEPNKSQYRKFKIKNVVGQSDVDCMAEMLERRLKHNEWKLPNVILVDGGLPQVHKVLKVIKSSSHPLLTSPSGMGRNIPVVGIAKGPERKRNDFVISTTDFKNTDSTDSKRKFVKWVNENKSLLIQVRDEAHRFAIIFQKSLRKLV